jgi:CBS domain containing-hemolysin-like protein
MLGFWLVADVLTPALPSVAARLLLRASLPAVNAVRLLLFPFLLWPLGRWRSRFLAVPAAEGSLEEEVSRFVQEKIEDAGAGRDALRGQNQHNMIFGILDLDKTLVREVMTPRVEVKAVEDSATATEVRKAIVASGHSRLPVYRETIDHVVGIIHAKDLLRELPADNPQGTLTPLLRNPVLIPETKNVATLLTEFQQNRAHFAVVLDEYGGTAGIITLEDILEEIIGDIHDEHDRQKGEPELRVLPDGSLIAAGRVPVAELARHIALELPETTDYDTVAGLILSALGRIPVKGEIVETPQALFQILDADARRVLRVKVTAKQPAESGNTP